MPGIGPHDVDTVRGDDGVRRGNTLLLVIFLAALASILILGRIFAVQQRKDIMRRKGVELSAVRDLKIDQIVEWRMGLLGDGETISEDPALADELRQWLIAPDDPEAQDHLIVWMTVLEKTRGYNGAVIVTRDASRWLTTLGHGKPNPIELAEARGLLRSGETTLTDMYLEPATGHPRLDVLAPVRGADGAIAAVIVLHRDPEMFLFPLLQKWPTPSSTSETLLFRADGDSVLYLNNLRFRPDSSMRFRVPRSNSTVLAVQALQGPDRTIEGSDYRGADVFGAVGSVPGTSWHVVAKIDQSEALAGIAAIQTIIISMAVGLLCVVGLALMLVWRQRTAEQYRATAESERARAELAEQYGNIVNRSPSGIYLCRLEDDERLVVIGANPAADHLLGIESAQLIGKTIEEAFPGLVETDVPDLYRAVAKGDVETQSFEIPYEDDRFTGYYSVTAFQTLPSVMAINFVDISARRRAEEELRERTDELVRSNAELEKFAYVASHDLQEPLRMIASYTQLLQRRYEGRLDKDADEFIEYAVDGATRMQQLINELLAYSRVGSQGAEFVDTDLNQVLDRVLNGLTVAVTESDAEITHDRLPTVPCDPTQIGQVLQNLIGNAIKFRGPDSPRIHIGAMSEGDGWVICVRDNGIGIQPEYFDRVFVIFQRLESRAHYPGTGMGLAICKRIIERHGGRIWVESVPGQGSTFFFTLKEHREPR